MGPQVIFPSPPKLSKKAVEAKQKAHDKAKARLPTSVELAEIENRKRKRAQTLLAASLEVLSS